MIGQWFPKLCVPRANLQKFISHKPQEYSHGSQFKKYGLKKTKAYTVKLTFDRLLSL